MSLKVAKFIHAFDMIGYLFKGGYGSDFGEFLS
ncbi:MAG: hypothetical protein RIT36_1567 [Bacteroidota bacterium]